MYGKKYDLSAFQDKHPGGKYILEKTKGQKDITALFESYHAFSNIEQIKKQLATFEIPTNKIEPYPDFTTYRKLVSNVKDLYRNRKSIKATTLFFSQMAVTLSVLCLSFYFTYMANVSSSMVKYGSQIIYSVAETSVMFNLLHDGSHYGICMVPVVNEWISKLANNFVFWNSNTWFHHHVYLHHSFTGLEDDPDHKIYYKTNMWSLLAIYTLIPGQLIGQALIYGLIPFRKKYAFYKDEFPMPNYDLLDICMIGTKLWFMFHAGSICFLLHVFVINTLYMINIYPNHTSYESQVENKYSGNDWAQMQIRHSGNFVPGNVLWTRMFGSINYQIEHHLFPNMSNVHYPHISAIVRRYCLENSIPYVCHDSLYDTFFSFQKYIHFSSKKN